MTTKDFPTADVLSVTTGKLVSDRRMDGLCDLVAWLTYEKPFPRVMDQATTRQLLTASAKARDLLIWQHPWLLEAQPPAGVDNSGLLDWLLEVEKRRGETLTVGREDMLGGAVLGLVAFVDYAKQALIELATALGGTSNGGAGCLCPHDLQPDGALVRDGVLALGCPVHDPDAGEGGGD